MRLLAVLMALVPICATAQSEWNKEAIERHFRAATLYIEAELDGRVTPLGTGVVIDEHGHVLTAKHIFECADCLRAKILARIGSRFKGGEPIELKHVERDRQADVALLKFVRRGQWKVAPMRGGPPPKGKIFALGFPLNDDFTSVSGEITNSGLGGGEWRTDLRIQRGNSGGPVFDTAGKLVALAAGGVPQEPDFKTILSISVAQELLKNRINLTIPGATQQEEVRFLIDTETLAARDRGIAERVRMEFEDIGYRLKKVRRVYSESEAEYRITNLRIVTDGSTIMIIGSFNRPDAQAQEVVGKCIDCTSPQEAPAWIVADLIHQTLLHPKWGPYGVLRVANCTPDVDPSKVVLKLQWKGLGFERALHYELGELRGAAEPSPTGSYIDMVEVVTEEDQQFEGRFKKSPAAIEAKRPVTCAGASNPQLSDVVFMRVALKPTTNATLNSNPRSLY